MTNREKRFLIIVAVLLVAILFLLFLISKTDQPIFSVTFLNAGQGDAALIKFRDGQTMLVDCGPNKDILWRLGANLPFFRRTLDYLVITHPDLDHYGGCSEVLDRYKVKNIITNGEVKQDKYFAIWQQAREAEGAQEKIISASEEKNIAGTKLIFLFASASSSWDYNKSEGNNKSLVFKLIDEQSKISILFTGDMETPLENALLKTYCVGSSVPCNYLQSDILKVGHHGSDSSSSEEFLGAVAPARAIISVGPNSFGHPSLRTMRKLERAGAEILRTDQIGDIIIIGQ